MLPRHVVDESAVTEVRLEVLAQARATAAVPGAAEVAARLGRPVALVVEAFQTLADTHVYVLEPGDPTRLRMANPFSAVPTPFEVEAGGRRYHGNCVWDALGIVSLIGAGGRVRVACPDCQAPMTMEVSGGELAPIDAVVHFGVPARRWWDDIIHT